MSESQKNKYCLIKEETNDELIIIGITEFCKNENINFSMLMRNSKKGKFYKGWRVKEWKEIIG